MLTIATHQADRLALQVTLRNIERLESFFESLHWPRYDALDPNARRSLIVRAARRALHLGTDHTDDVARVVVLMLAQGSNFDLLARERGGLFGREFPMTVASLREGYEVALDLFALRSVVEGSAEASTRPAAQPA